MRHPQGGARVLWCALALVALAACARQAPRYTVAPAPLRTPSGTVAVTVSPDGGECSRERSRCASSAALEHVLFRGVPGSAQPTPLVADERAARGAHGPFLKALVDGEAGQQYVLSATASSAGHVVTVNLDRLRDALVREGVIRRFGY